MRAALEWPDPRWVRPDATSELGIENPLTAGPSAAKTEEIRT